MNIKITQMVLVIITLLNTYALVHCGERSAPPSYALLLATGEIKSLATPQLVTQETAIPEIISQGPIPMHINRSAPRAPRATCSCEECLFRCFCLAVCVKNCLCCPCK